MDWNRGLQAGIGLVIAAGVAIGWSLMSGMFSDRDTDVATVTVDLGPATESLPLPAPRLMIPADEVRPAVLNDAVWAMLPAVSERHMGTETANMTAHYSNDAETVPEQPAPVWLSGTIEPLEESTAPSVVPIEVRQAVGYDRIRH